MSILLIGGAGLLGLLLGSFGNVLIHRVPRGESIVSPPSACPACGHVVRARHNVPVLSWMWLGGRCTDCGAPISARYPVIEAGTGVAFGAVAWWTGLSWELPLLLGLVYFGIVLSAIDVDVRRLPDPLTGAFALWTVAVIVLAALVEGSWEGALRAVLGALVLGALYGGAFVAYPKGMGFGDVKLAPTLGALLAWLGWPELVVGGFAAFLWGAMVGVVTMLATRRRRGVAIPFGPWMFVGAATGAAMGPAVADWYLALVGI